MRSFMWVVIALTITGAAAVSAQVTTTSSVGFDMAYYFADQQGFGLSDGEFAPITYQVREPDDGSVDDGERALGGSWGGLEPKAYYTHSWRIPALQWSDGPLAADNNVSIRSQTGVSPISVTQDIRAVVTPVAVLQFTAGTTLGTGWNIQIFDGLGLVDETSGEVDPASFEGLVVRSYVGGTFQFDLAAVFPGEWNHVVTVVSPQWTYNLLTTAGSDEAWSFEADSGANYNGWTYRTTAFLGYQPPLALNTVGVLYEGTQLVGAAVERARDAAPADFDPGFRDDRLSLVTNFGFGDNQQHSLTIVGQFRRNRLASEDTIFLQGVQRRETVGGYWDFYRVAVQYRLALN